MRVAATLLMLVGMVPSAALADSKALCCDTIVEVAARDGSRAEAEISRVLDQTFKKAPVCSQDGGWAQGRYYVVSTIDHGGKDTNVCFDLTPASKSIAQAYGRAVAAQADSGTRSRTDTSDCAKGEVIAKRIPAEPVTMKRKWLSKAMPGSRVVSQTLVRSSGLLFARLKVAGADGSSQNICVNVDSYLSDCGYPLACKSGAKGCDENKGGRRIVRDSPLDHIIVVPR